MPQKETLVFKQLPVAIKIAVVSFFILFCQFKIQAQTALSAGDIAVIGWTSSRTNNGVGIITWTLSSAFPSVNSYKTVHPSLSRAYTALPDKVKLNSLPNWVVIAGMPFKANCKKYSS